MKSKQTFLSLLLFLVGAGQLSAFQDQIPIPIYTSEEESIIIRTPNAIRISCVYDTDNHLLIFSVTGSTESITLVINNSDTHETINTVLVGSGRLHVPISGDAGSWHILLTLENGVVLVGQFNMLL